jgi:hypothetical protein
MKTKCDGIEFRSKTEAAWYLALNAYGLDPVYEPETVTLESLVEPVRSCLYIPDFSVSLDGERHFVEVKAGTDDEGEDIAKACILGYKVPTLIIVGWTLRYTAIVINERRKGNPYGFELMFRSSLHNNLCITNRRPVRLFSSYPDENWLEMDEEDLALFTPSHEPARGTRERDILSAAWNRTQWKR